MVSDGSGIGRTACPWDPGGHVNRTTCAGGAGTGIQGGEHLGRARRGALGEAHAAPAFPTVRESDPPSRGTPTPVDHVRVLRACPAAARGAYWVYLATLTGQITLRNRTLSIYCFTIRRACFITPFFLRNMQLLAPRTPA